VVRLLGIYLLTLIPFNYFFFWLIGRLEFAWLLAPLISLVGAVLIARSAQLDIGFARSRTELALLELPAGYSRGHLTRTLAVYNSLSTVYQFQFADRDAAASTPGIQLDGDDQEELVWNTSSGTGPSLTGFRVPSNQVSMLRCEQVWDTSGKLSLAGDTLQNATSLALSEVVVLRHNAHSGREFASIASLAAGANTKLRFRPISEFRIAGDLPMQTSVLFDDLCNRQHTTAGVSQLVARIDGVLTGMTVLPDMNQVVGQTILLAHLTYGELPPVVSDENLPASLQTKKTNSQGPRAEQGIPLP
jgi:hypothetical protein